MLRRLMMLLVLVAVFLTGTVLGTIASPAEAAAVQECFNDICRDDACTHEPPYAYYCSDTTGECKITPCAS